MCSLLSFCVGSEMESAPDSSEAHGNAYRMGLRSLPRQDSLSGTPLLLSVAMRLSKYMIDESGSSMCRYAACRVVVVLGSRRTPGPIVGESAMDRTYVPRAPDGFARTT